MPGIALSGEKILQLKVRPVAESEIKQIGEALARFIARDASEAVWYRDYWPERVQLRPDFSLDMLRVGELNGQIVAHAMIEPFNLRYGSARLSVAGISKIFTERGYRKRGFSAAVMRDALAYAVETGVHLALVHGIPDYFTRFGFSPVWPEYLAEFDSAALAALETPLKLREPHIQETPSIAALYEQSWSGRVSLIRSPETWLWRMNGGDAARRVLVAVDPGGQINGYIAGRHFTGSEVEVVAATPEAVLTLLSFAGQLHLDKGLDRVRWLMPPDDPLLVYARQIVDLDLTARYRASGGWMARLIDTRTLVEALLPEIVEQARFIFPRLKPDQIIMGSHKVGMEIGLRNQPTTFAHLQQRDFIQILFGSLHPGALPLRDELAPEAVRLLEALFPVRVAALGLWDWF